MKIEKKKFYVLLSIIAVLITVGWIGGPKIVETVERRYNQIVGNNQTADEKILYFVAVTEPAWEPETTSIVPAPLDGNGARILLVVADQEGQLHYVLVTTPDARIMDYTRTRIYLVSSIGIDERGQAGFENPQEFTGSLLRWRNDQGCWIELPHAARPTVDGMTCLLP